MNASECMEDYIFELQLKQLQNESLTKIQA